MLCYILKAVTDLPNNSGPKWWRSQARIRYTYQGYHQSRPKENVPDSVNGGKLFSVLTDRVSRAVYSILYKNINNGWSLYRQTAASFVFPWCIQFFSQHFQILRLNLWSHSRNWRHFSRMLSSASRSASPVVPVKFVTTAHSTNSCSCGWHHCFPSCSSWRLFPFSYSHWCRTLACSMSEAMARSVGRWLRENNKPKCCKTQTSKYVSTVWQHQPYSLLQQPPLVKPQYFNKDFTSFLTCTCKREYGTYNLIATTLLLFRRFSVKYKSSQAKAAIKMLFRGSD